MKWILSLVMFLGGTTLLAQTNTKMDNHMYQIEEYQIYPASKTVCGVKWISGNRYTYASIKEIDYQSTNMIFCGKLFFKETFPVKADLSSLKMIHHSIGYQNERTYLLSPTEDAVYVLKEWIIATINVKGVTHVKGLIFKDGAGKLYFIPTVNHYALIPIHLSIDEATLQHVKDDYYTDKNGLYYFSSSGISKMLEPSHGKPIQATAHNQYLVYGDVAYANGVRMNASLLRNIQTIYGNYLVDGPTHPILSPLIKEGLPVEPMNEWEYFDVISVSNRNLIENTVYYSSKEIYSGGGSYYHLIKTKNNWYAITGSSNNLRVVKLDNVMIYNLQTDKYETIEIDKFKRLTVNSYTYKGQMYYSNSEPIETNGVDINKLHCITLHGKSTEFLTDGKTLFGGYNLGKMKVEERGKHRWRIFTDLFQQVDWKSLHIVSESIMLDKNNIYQVSNTMLEVIPIDRLGLKVWSFEKDGTNAIPTSCTIQTEQTDQTNKIDTLSIITELRKSVKKLMKTGNPNLVNDTLFGDCINAYLEKDFDEIILRKDVLKNRHKLFDRHFTLAINDDALSKHIAFFTLNEAGNLKYIQTYTNQEIHYIRISVSTKLEGEFEHSRLYWFSKRKNQWQFHGLTCAG